MIHVAELSKQSWVDLILKSYSSIYLFYFVEDTEKKVEKASHLFYLNGI